MTAQLFVFHLYLPNCMYLRIMKLNLVKINGCLDLSHLISDRFGENIEQSCCILVLCR